MADSLSSLSTNYPANPKSLAVSNTKKKNGASSWSFGIIYNQPVVIHIIVACKFARLNIALIIGSKIGSSNEVAIGNGYFTETLPLLSVLIFDLCN